MRSSTVALGMVFGLIQSNAMAYYISSPNQYNQWTSYGPNNITWDTLSGDAKTFDLYVEYPTNVNSLTGRAYIKVAGSVEASKKSLQLTSCVEWPRTVQAAVIFVSKGANASIETNVKGRSPSFIIDNTSPWLPAVAGTKPSTCNSSSGNYIVNYVSLVAPYKTPDLGVSNWQKIVDKSQWPLIIHELHNLAAKYQHFSFNGNYQYICRDLFADRIDSYIGIPFGFNGVEGCYEYAQTIHSDEYSYEGGTVRDRIMASPYIQVAGDGKTAKGVWDGLGPDTAQAKTGEAHWLYGKYGLDFIKTDDGWRIWHLQFFPVFFTQPSLDWVAAVLQNNSDATPPLTAPGMWIYNEYGHPGDFPHLPDPYWSFADRDAFVLNP
ncbi:hypothetical protein VE03_09155 [Pseudogymnoascus sp. 23342-1-I1]|nr:hypothetical protein VE03_09155 [Pseudogymnoascus sp. 23342-1-I1]